MDAIEWAPGTTVEQRKNCPQPVVDFAQWLKEYAIEHGFHEHPERYSWAHFYEVKQVAAERFGIELGEDGGFIYVPRVQ